MDYGGSDQESLRQQQQQQQQQYGEDRALQYCNYIFEVVLNLGTCFGSQAGHQSSLTTRTAAGTPSNYVPSSIYVVADHLSRVLLDDVAARACITDRLPLDLAFREAVWIVHGKFLAGYIRWAQQMQLPMRPVDQHVINPSTKYTDDSVVRMLLSETALLLLLHTEATSLQEQLPSSCCLLYWLLRFSVQFKGTVENTPMLSHAAAWSAPWNSRDAMLEVQAIAVESLAGMGHAALAQVEREWASQKDSGHHPSRVLANIVSHVATGKVGGGLLTAQDALKVAYVFSACDAAVLLEEVIQPLTQLLNFLEAHIRPAHWPAVCAVLESRLRTTTVLQHALGSLSVVDCHRVAHTFQALRELGRTADGSFSSETAAVWWEELLLSDLESQAAAHGPQLGSTWHLLMGSLLVAQGSFALTISLIPARSLPVCRASANTRCISLANVAWSALIITQGVLRLVGALVRVRYYRHLTQLPRLTSTLAPEVCAAAMAKCRQLPHSTPMGLKESKTADAPPLSWGVAWVRRGEAALKLYAKWEQSVWGSSLWLVVLVTVFGLMFAPGMVGQVCQDLWWITAGAHVCMVFLSLAQDLCSWRQTDSKPPPTSFGNRLRQFIRTLLWLSVVFGLPTGVMWVLSLPSNQSVVKMLWVHRNWGQLRQVHKLQTGGSAPLALLTITTLLTNLLGGTIMLLIFSMVLRVLLWVWAGGGGPQAPLRSKTGHKWEELCGSFDELAETWCAKCLPKEGGEGEDGEEEESGSNAGRFPVVWNGLVEDLVQRDLLASSEGETLNYTRIINVTTPSLLNSLGLPNMMPPAFVVGPQLHQWLQQKADPMATVTLPIMQVLRLLLLLLHHADVLTTGELIVMSLAVEEGMRVAKRQHVALKHILVEGMKIVSWSYKGGVQPNTDWLSMVKKHSKMTDAIFNYIAAFQLGVNPSVPAEQASTPTASPRGVAPREASADHLGFPQVTGNLSDSVTSVRSTNKSRMPSMGGAEDGEDVDLSILIVNRETEAEEEAAKVTSLISRNLPALKTRLAAKDDDNDGTTPTHTAAESCSTPTCSELEFGGGLDTPRSNLSMDSPTSVKESPRAGPGGERGREKESRGGRRRKKKGHEVPPPPPLMARLLRKTMGKSQYFMALCLYMVKLRRTPTWSKSAPEVESAAEELVSFLESVFHPALGEEPAPPALTVPSLTSILPLQPEQLVLPVHQEPNKLPRSLSDADSKESLLQGSDPYSSLFGRDGRPSHKLNRLIKRHFPEWQNFQERIAALTGRVPLDVRPRSFLKGGRLHRYQWDFLMWVGQRSPTLAHQLKVLSSLHRATPTLLSAERPLSLAVGPKVYALWLEAVADLKFQALVLAPNLCEQMDGPDSLRRWNAKAVAGLLNRHSFMRTVAIQRESCRVPGHPSRSAIETRDFSMLLRGRHNSLSPAQQVGEEGDYNNGPRYGQNGSMKGPKHHIPDTADLTLDDLVAVYTVKLPRNPYSTPGGGASTVCGVAHAALCRPYVFTEFVHSCTSPLATLGLGPALLIRNMLNELFGHDTFSNVFMGTITSVSVPVMDAANSVTNGGESLKGWAAHGGNTLVADKSDVVSVSSCSVQDFVNSGPRYGQPPLPPTSFTGRTPSVHSSGNLSTGLSLMMPTMHTMQGTVSTHSGSPLSTPKLSTLNPWTQWQRTMVTTDGDASSVTQHSLGGRDVTLSTMLGTIEADGARDAGTPRSFISFMDAKRTSRTSVDLDSTTDLQATPHGLERPDQTYFNPNHPPHNTVSLPSLEARMKLISSGTPRLPSGGITSPSTTSTSSTLNHSLALPPPSSARSADTAAPGWAGPSLASQSSGPISTPMFGQVHRVSGGPVMDIPETTTGSVITINSAVPNFESMYGSQMLAMVDDGQPLLSSAAAVVEQRFVTAASTSRRLEGFVTGQFVPHKSGPAGARHLAALANLLCVPAQVVGRQPASLCIQDKALNLGPSLEESVAAVNSGETVSNRLSGWVCRYIMVDMNGPQNAEELSTLMAQLLSGGSVEWLCKEGEQTLSWVQKVLANHTDAVLWCMRLLLVYIPFRSLAQLLASPAYWSNTLRDATADTFILPAWTSNSMIEFWVELSVSMTGLLLMVPFLHAVLVTLLYGWPVAQKAGDDLTVGWLPAAATLLLSAIPGLSARPVSSSGVPPATSIPESLPPTTAQAATVAVGNEPGTPAAEGATQSGRLTPFKSQLQLPLPFVQLHSRWGWRLWPYGLWLMLLGILVLCSISPAAGSHAALVYTTATAGIFPVVLGFVLVLAPSCLQHGPAQRLSIAASHFHTWLQYMAEDLSTNTGHWRAAHDRLVAATTSSHRRLWAWAVETLVRGCCAAVVSWYGIQQLKAVTRQERMHSASSDPLKSLTSGDSLFVVELLVRGAVAWALQIAVILCGTWLARLGREVHFGAMWSLALVIALSPVAVFIVCFYGVIGAAASVGSSFLSLFVILVGNAAAAGFVQSLLFPLRTPVLRGVLGRFSWFGDVLVGLVVLSLWMIPALLDPLYWWVYDRYQNLTGCIRHFGRRRTAPQVEPS